MIDDFKKLTNKHRNAKYKGSPVLWVADSKEFDNIEENYNIFWKDDMPAREFYAGGQARMWKKWERVFNRVNKGPS